jgi:signal transduction histidine kinase
MREPKKSDSEAARLGILHELEILDTESEASLDELTALAAEVLDMPMVLISLVDTERQWFKSKVGLNAAETPRSVSFCGHAILESKTLIVEDAARDERFWDNPLVAGAPHVTFYAGVPLEVGGQLLGTFCAIDSQRRSLSSKQKDLLELIARQVQTHLKHKYEVVKSKKLNLKLYDLTLELQLEKNNVEAFSKNKASFYSQMNHEIRTPLQGVLGSLGLMRSSTDHKIRERHADSAAVCAEFLLTVTNDILDLGKIENKNLDLTSSSFSLGDLLERIKMMALSLYSGKDIEARFEEHFEPGIILNGDKNRLTQIVLNLISNSFKYTDRGSIVMETRYLPNQQMLILKVSDTGIGIDEKQVNNLFDQYFRASHEDKKERPGTGIGLYIVKKLVERMNGKISVESKVGKGSCFTVNIPLSISAPSQVPVKQDFMRFPAPLRILVADDNMMVLKITKQMLEQAGAQVDFAYNGQEAAQKAIEGRYDLVLMDTNMPKLDGPGATEVIRKSKFGRSIKVVSYTATASGSLEESYLYDGCILKPASLDELVQGICQVLAKKTA